MEDGKLVHYTPNGLLSVPIYYYTMVRAAIRTLHIFDYKGQRAAGNRTEVESTELLLYYIMYLHI